MDSRLQKWFEFVTGKLGPASISLSSQGLQHDKLLVSIFNRIVHRSDCGNRSGTFAFEASVLGPANQDIYSDPIPNRSQFIPIKIPMLGIRSWEACLAFANRIRPLPISGILRCNLCELALPDHLGPLIESHSCFLHPLRFDLISNFSFCLRHYNG